ncbi:hypothetical protein FIV41_24540 [Pseudomonas marginalis]|uniref:Uncharacterized protein n=1 Tax=Pseudomonas marginalis TaxID=298 RepID=A0A9X9FVV1_PSEMA|nr:MULTISPECIES: hypothetical protein [Pseudomonas]MDT9634747.1 hypothetical protein [Pseudomonas sp. JV449]TWR53342.1 hypothetical protein FIV41_24540 [Pseudomonas marginalis]CRM44536.1 hypothetical protein [Pseudomonas sp. 8 R 14]SAM31956.1 hypothetical protein BN1864_LIB5394:02003 [Pseudomonas sp. 1 R 17]
MLSSINATPLPPPPPTTPQDDTALQRKKRSIEDPQLQLEPQEADGSSRNRPRSGGLDSLGKGNLL